MNTDLAYWQKERQQLYSAQKFWLAKLEEPANGNPYHYEEASEAMERLRELDRAIHAVENEIDAWIAELS